MFKKKEKKTKVNEKKPLTKRWWFWLIVVLLVCGVIGSFMGTDDTTEEAESHIYDNAEVIDVMNGYGTEKVGEMSQIEISSEEVTEEALNDWYYNYVLENDFNYCIIIYTDYDNGLGAYAISTMVETNVYYEKNDNGLYMIADESQSTMYMPGDGELMLIESDD